MDDNGRAVHSSESSSEDCACQPPFVSRFQTKTKNYIYDVNTNTFVQVAGAIYDVIYDIGNVSLSELIGKYSTVHPEEEIVQAVREVARLQRSGRLFSAFRPARLRFPLTLDRVTKKLNSEMQQLILSLTEQCNLRCRYCVYSGSYTYQRGHSDRWMDFTTAQKAVDYFVQHSFETARPTLGFYGGEPLLAGGLMRQVVQYVNTNYPSRLRFDMTTNGTLLSDDVISFLVDNDFNVQVSLDGPPDIHDAMRVYSNGKGSFETVIGNLRRLKNDHPEFFRNNVGFNVCLNNFDEIDKIHDYFVGEDELFSAKLISISYVDPRDTDLFQRGVIPASQGRSIEGMMSRFIDAVVAGGEPDWFVNSLFDLFIQKIHKRSGAPLKEDHYPNGVCVPGVRRVLCDTSGELTICERVNHGLSIGHIDHGIDPERVLQLATDYADISSAECRNCWAVRLCSACFRDLYRDRFDMERKREFCDTERRVLSAMMSVYCGILEKNEKAFDYINNGDGASPGV